MSIICKKTEAGETRSMRSLLQSIVSFCFLGSIVGLTFMMIGCKFQPGWGYNKGHAPEQPIPYSHEVHVGKLGMQCQYCHNQVERSKHSNVPTLQTCMNCHIQVKTDSPHIQKMREAYDAGKSIEWTRVHMLPDHVQFNHSAHVTKGVNCQTCHGPVEKMEKVYQHSDLSMGWCINCHRQEENKAPLNCTTCHH